jgi:hypothetical protein
MSAGIIAWMAAFAVTVSIIASPCIHWLKHSQMPWWTKLVLFVVLQSALCFVAWGFLWLHDLWFEQKILS